MTRKEWKDLDLPIEWSIFYADDFDYSNPSEEYFLSRELNLDAPEGIEDGTYDCYYGYEQPKRREGIVVKNGKFVPKPTAECIYQLVWRSECRMDDGWNDYVRRKYQRFFEQGRTIEATALSNGYSIPSQNGDPVAHKYVERLLWNGEYFILTTGS